MLIEDQTHHLILDHKLEFHCAWKEAGQKGTVVVKVKDNHGLYKELESSTVNPDDGVI